MKFNRKGRNVILTLLGVILFTQAGNVNGQSLSSIRGSIIEESSQPIGYATVALFNSSDSSLVQGTLSDSTGYFELTTVAPGDYLIKVSFMGYSAVTRPVTSQGRDPIALGEIILQEIVYEIEEAKVIGERMKARQQADKTTYYVNKHMQKASSTAIDMMKLIPGMQVDLLQRISLEGNTNVIILVDGVERETGFLSQLDSERIDKVEIMDNPGARYNGDIAGVINIILKKDMKIGASGHVYAELPLTPNEIYVFPSYSFNYMRNKLNVFTSYNGELSYFNIKAVKSREMHTNTYESQLNRVENVRQKNWSHKFHYGLDYSMNEKNLLSIYGFVNPRSVEFDGTVQVNTTFQDSMKSSWEADKEDTDRNLSRFNSLYYKHNFNRKGAELAIELNHYYLNALHRSELVAGNEDAPLINSSLPEEIRFTGKVDVVIPVSSTVKIETGLLESIKLLSDNNAEDFSFTEKVGASYASFIYGGNRLQANAGMRIEIAQLGQEKSYTNKSVDLLPSISVKYDLSKQQNLKIGFRKSVIRPNIYQLNPNTGYSDPYTFQRGNTHLNPELRQDITLDYSLQTKNNFISIGGFFNKTNGSIEYLTVVNENMVSESTLENLGDIYRYGISLSGSTKPHKNILFNPSIKVYNTETRGNAIARDHSIQNKKQLAVESGFALIASLKHDFTVSAMLRYSSPIASIQGSRFEDMLYMISVEKSFKDKFKIGITSALPFSREFTYRGHERSSYGFHEYSEDNIQMSVFPIWLKLKYTLASGSKVKRINRSNDIKETKRSNGF